MFQTGGIFHLAAGIPRVVVEILLPAAGGFLPLSNRILAVAFVILLVAARMLSAVEILPVLLSFFLYHMVIEIGDWNGTDKSVKQVAVSTVCEPRFCGFSKSVVRVQQVT